MNTVIFHNARDEEDSEACLRHRCASETTNERVGGACGQAPVPRDQVPDDRSDQAGADHVGVHGARLDDPFADRRGDVKPEKPQGDEIEKGGPDDGERRRKDAGGDDRAIEFAAS
jgi:hypothetical protein